MEYPKARNDLRCPECSGYLYLKKLPQFKNPFYGCENYPACKGSHGAHSNGAPLGIPASSETKEWRIKAHDVFDKLWKKPDGVMKRKEAYAFLAQLMDVEKIHIGESDIETCKKIVELLKENESDYV